MATTKKTAAAVDDTAEAMPIAAAQAAEETVCIKVAIDPLHPKDRELFVALNGQTFLIKRGEAVDVPAGVAEIIEHAEAQKAAALEYICNASSN
jgi:hypothetical protein